MNKFTQNNGKSSQNYQAKKIVINNGNHHKEKSLSEIIKSHPVIIYCEIAVAAFGMGFGTKNAIESTMNQELVTKNSYTLNKDIEKEYVPLSQYLDLSEQNKRNESEIASLQITIRGLKEEINNQDAHKEWLERYDKLVQERAGFENQLNNLNNLSTGIKNYSDDSYKAKKDELIRKIQSRDEQINIMLNKFY